MVICGSVGNSACWTAEPAVSAVVGRPKPSPKSMIVSPGAAGVNVYPGTDIEAGPR
jgi:hypothetical protein